MKEVGLPRLPLRTLIETRIYQALRQNHWNQSHAAKELEISIRSVRQYVKRFRDAGLTIPTIKPGE